MQNDFTIDNDFMVTVRLDITSAFQALATQSSGAAAPGTTFAYQRWADTTAGLLKQRNGANSAWLTKGDLANSVSTLALALLTDTTQAAMQSRLGVPAVGVLLGRQIFSTPGGSTYTPTAGTNRVVVECVGGGGGGGGVALTGASQVASAQGGSGGAYSKKLITASFSGVTVTVGAAGTAGSAGNNAGGNGGTSSFGALLSAPGGTGGSGAAAAALAIGYDGIWKTGGAAAGGDVNISGGHGVSGCNFSVTAPCGGQGGDSALGRGGKALASNSNNGNTATGYGAGGGGSANAQSQGTARSGGAGSAGAVLVWEYA